MKYIIRIVMITSLSVQLIIKSVSFYVQYKDIAYSIHHYEMTNFITPLFYLIFLCLYLFILLLSIASIFYFITTRFKSEKPNFQLIFVILSHKLFNFLSMYCYPTISKVISSLITSSSKIPTRGEMINSNVSTV